jgi:hypothetical protein
MDDYGRAYRGCDASASPDSTDEILPCITRWQISMLRLHILGHFSLFLPRLRVPISCHWFRRNIVTGRSLRDESSKDMALPHPQSGKEH